MKQIFSMAAYEEGLKEYRDKEDIQKRLGAFGVDGLEVIFCGGGYQDKIKKDMVFGVHLCFFPFWLDYWNRDEQAVLNELGSRDIIKDFYGGSLERAKETYLSWFERDLDEAEAIGAEYVVFHVSEVTIGGVYTGRHCHTDLEVVDAAAEVINRLMSRRSHAKYAFLVENLQHPGLNMKDSAITKRLLDQIEYPNKGVMFDTGHFMGVNRNVTSEEQGMRLIHQMLDQHEELLPFFRGIHLHKAVMTEGFCGYHEKDPTEGKPYFHRFRQVYEFLDQMDPHEPFSLPQVKRLVERIRPQWLVHELLPGKSGREREKALKKQISLILPDEA